jgi:hypothetical protein
MLFLLLDRADADRRARCRQGPGAEEVSARRLRIYGAAGKGVSPAEYLLSGDGRSRVIAPTYTIAPPQQAEAGQTHAEQGEARRFRNRGCGGEETHIVHSNNVAERSRIGADCDAADLPAGVGEATELDPAPEFGIVNVSDDPSLDLTVSPVRLTPVRRAPNASTGVAKL